MKNRENEAGVPRCNVRIKKTRNTIIAVILMAASVMAGYHTSNEDVRLPVLLANGEVILQPCYVAADGNCIALVKNEAEAKKVVTKVKEEYKNESTVEVEIEENTSIGNLKLKNGAEKPEIMSAEQASKKIIDKQAVTVKTTEVIELKEPIEYEVIEKETEKLNAGDSKIEQSGETGVEMVTKVITKENGEVVAEEIVDQEILKESVPEIKLSGTAGMADPLDEMVITSDFGPRWGRNHNGMDFGMPEGSPVYAAKAGTVICAEYRDSFGNLVIIDHGDGIETYYAHCSRLDVISGQTVDTSQQIAAVGSTGNSTGPHLHFEVRVNGCPENPEEWLDFNGGSE